MHSKVNFEDIPLGNNRYTLLQTYRDLTWTNFYAYDPPNIYRRLPDGGDGYLNGLTSGKQEAFSARSSTAHISVDEGQFDLKRAYLTSPFRDTDSVTAVGYHDGNEIYRISFDIVQSTPTLVQFDFRDIDDVSFTSASGTQIVFDDIVLGHILSPAQSSSLGSAFEDDQVSFVSDPVSLRGHADVLQAGIQQFV